MIRIPFFVNTANCHVATKQHHATLPPLHEGLAYAVLLRQCPNLFLALAPIAHRIGNQLVQQHWIRLAVHSRIGITAGAKQLPERRNHLMSLGA